MTLRAQELKLDESVAERERLTAKMASQASMMDLQRAEAAAMVAELKRLLAEKDDLAQTRSAEQDKALREAEDKARAVQAQLDAVRSEHTDALAAVTVQAQQRNKRVLELQAEVEDAERAKTQLLEKLEAADTEIAARRKTLHARQLELDDSQTEAAHLKDRVAALTAATEASRAQQDKVVAQLNDLLREKQALLEAEKTQHDQDVRAAESKLAAALTTIEANARDHAREAAEARQELAAAGDAAQREIAAREEETAGVRAELQASQAHAASLQAQIDEQTTALLAASGELESTRLQLDQLEEAERQTRVQAEAKERALRDSMVKEAAREAGDTKKMREQIRGMAHRRAPNAEDKAVDVQKYLAVALMGPPPDGIAVAKLTVKGELLKPFAGMSATNWKNMWSVLDLQNKSLTFYSDKRELKSLAKGAISLADISKVTIPDTEEAKETFSFLVSTGKRTTHLRALSRAHMDVWIHVFAAVTIS